MDQVLNRNKFFIQWIVANIAGFLVTFVLMVFLDHFLGDAATGDVIGHLIVLITGGILYGVFQWLALRHRITLSRANVVWNTVACTVGITAGFIIGFVLAGPPIDFVGSVILVGLLSSIVQWVVLRRQVLQAGWWFLTSIASFLLAALLGAAFLLLLADGLDQLVGGGTMGFLAIMIVYCLLIGLVAGSITGSVLPRLMLRPLSPGK